MSSSATAPGALLGGRYRLEALIATGGMGEVWRARDETLGREVAVKVLRRDLAGDEDFAGRFRDEARHTAALSHPGIAAVHDYAETDGARYLVMELVDGEPLSDRLAREGALDPVTTLRLMRDVALALQAAHDAGVVHRDIKPGNLLLRADGVVKVTDFGIARAAESTSQRTATGTVLGSAYYLSPEMARGERVTAASDIYSLGVVGYECLAGRRPFTGTNPVKVATAHVRDVPPPLPATVPRELARLVLQCMAKDPARRPPAAAEVAAAAGALLSAELATPAQAAPDAPTAEQTRPLATDPSAAAASGGTPQAVVRRNLVIVGALVVLAGFFALRSCDVGSEPTPTGGASPAAVRVELVTSRYVGRPSAEVVRELQGLGLTPVTRTTTEDDDNRPGTVTGVSPDGSLARGSRVTVTVAAAEPAEPAQHKKKKGKGGDD